MMSEKDVDYEFDIKGPLLVFSTKSFLAEKGTLLHKGIYNRETASILSAGSCVMLIGFFFARNMIFYSLHFMEMLVIFVLLFLFFRTFIFIERNLLLVIDKDNKKITVVRKGTLNSKETFFPLTELQEVRSVFRESFPQNPDGMKVVEKIALQHGTVIPGFSGPAGFYTVELALRDDASLTVFSSGKYSEALDVTGTFKNFISGDPGKR